MVDSASMEQPAGRKPGPSDLAIGLILCTVLGVAVWALWVFTGPHGSIHVWSDVGLFLAIGVVDGGAILLVARQWASARTDEAEAWQRVRTAEDKLARELRFPALDPSFYDLPLRYPADDLVEDPPPETADRPQEQLAIERRDNRLTLAALWELTHGRLGLYHQIVTNQARRSFGAA
jgi:hypothetical protein